jgi:2-polyprenyl-3-methyl-5-hydroxy-6-metoxy-1,4-benzoquinol methylase
MPDVPPIEEKVEYHTNPRHDLLPYLPASVVRGLDVGCGAGAFGVLLKQRYGAEVWGLEYASDIAARARARLDRVLEGDAIQQLDALPDGYFDFMSCNDVLEHLVDPWAFLRKARSKLTANATVVASIPNIRYFHALETILEDKDFPALDEGIFDRTHLRFFTKKSIERLFAETGYQLQAIAGINPTHSKRFRRWNRWTFGRIEDCRWLQFACVARPIPSAIAAA